MLTEHGVPIAPRTFYAWAARAPSKRALWDATITEVLAGYYEPDEHGRSKPESLYGSLKMWAHLQREGIPVAKSTVERLMRRNGWQGVRRQKTVRTTIADPDCGASAGSGGPPVRCGRTQRLLVADFTYVKLITGVFVYVAFVIDAYAGAIIGWEASGSKHTPFDESAIRQAAALRARQGHPIEDGIHHSDADPGTDTQRETPANPLSPSWPFFDHFARDVTACQRNHSVYSLRHLGIRAERISVPLIHPRPTLRR